MTAAKKPPVYNDHLTTAEHALAVPGEWVSAGNYQTAEGAEATARKVRTGSKAAYEPAGAFQAVVRNEAGHTLWVRYVGTADIAVTTPAYDRRTVAQVAAKRLARSAAPHRFRYRLGRTLAAAKRGEDLATEVWTAVDPVRTAAEIEALAGLRRLSSTREDTK